MLPRYFPLHLRGTGESFAANIGGRLIGTSFAFVVFTVTDQKWQGIFPENLHGPEGFPMRVAYTTAAIGFFVFVLGWIIAAKLPDPKYGDHEAEDAADDPEDKKETVPLDDAVKEEDSSGGENDKAGEDDKG